MSRIGTVILTVLGCIAVLALAVVVVAYGGVVNVAASHGHVPGVEWFLATVRDSSIDARSKGIRPPAFDATDRQRGFEEYHEMCVTCHGAPGVEPGVIGKGLNPSPPELWNAERKTAQDFWVVKHGIRMTGMPAFGDTHDDEELWAIVSFVHELPRMSPEQYARLAREAEHSEGGMHGHSTEHSHSGS